MTKRWFISYETCDCEGNYPCHHGRHHYEVVGPRRSDTHEWAITEIAELHRGDLALMVSAPRLREQRNQYRAEVERLRAQNKALAEALARHSLIDLADCLVIPGEWDFPPPDYPRIRKAPDGPLLGLDRPVPPVELYLSNNTKPPKADHD